MASGAMALLSANTGTNNIAVGFQAGSNLVVGDNNIYLSSPAGAAIESNTMRFGTAGTHTSAFMAGVAGVSVANPAQVVIDTTTGQLGTFGVSSARYKRDIEAMGSHSRGVFAMRPVIFRYIQDPQGERQYGLIAEEVAQVYPELVTYNAEGAIETVRYHALAPMLLNEVQQQRQLDAQTQLTQQRFDAQAQELAALRAQNADLRAQLAQQQSHNAHVQAQLAAQQAQHTATAARLERLEAAIAHATTRASR